MNPELNYPVLSDVDISTSASSTVNSGAFIHELTINGVVSGDTCTGTLTLFGSCVQGVKGPAFWTPPATDDPSWFTLGTASVTEAGSTSISVSGKPFRWWYVTWTPTDTPSGTLNAYVYGFAI